jgi:hypothetical protein
VALGSEGGKELDGFFLACGGGLIEWPVGGRARNRVWRFRLLLTMRSLDRPVFLLLLAPLSLSVFGCLPGWLG